MSRLESLENLVAQTLQKLGVERFDVMQTLLEEWDSVAAEPWRSHSVPILLKGGELLVEATSPQAVSLLRYATGDLLRVLDEQFGEGVIFSIRVQSPAPTRRPR